MMNFNIVFGFLCLRLVWSQSISTPPSLVATRQGDDVTMTCRVANENIVMWSEFVTSSAGQAVYDNQNGVLEEYQDRIEVVNSAGNHDMTFISPSVQMGGYYSCYAYPVESARGDLIVLSEPTIIHGTLIEGQGNLVTCKGSYGADDDLPPEVRPHLRLTIDHTEVVELDGNFTELVRGEPGPGEDYVPWQIQLEAEHVFTGADHDVNMTCEVYTENPPATHRVSETLDVKYVVRNLELAPLNPYYFVGEYINCTAEGNPDPTIKWEPIYSGGAYHVEGGQLEIIETMLGQNIWQCSASNTVEGSEALTEEIEFEVVQPTSAAPAYVSRDVTALLLAAWMVIGVSVT